MSSLFFTVIVKDFATPAVADTVPEGDSETFGARIVHGAAGSATLTLVVLSTISSTFHALLYILLFGIGSMAGMLLVSLLISIPVKLAGDRLGSAVLPIQMGTGVLSCAFGLYLGVTIWSRLAG